MTTYYSDHDKTFINKHTQNKHQQTYTKLTPNQPQKKLNHEENQKTRRKREKPKKY